jgi:hypothetical protein
MKGNQVCSNKGPGPLQSGDNHNVEMGWRHLKIFSRTTAPSLSRLGTNHHWGKRIQVYSNEGHCLSSRGDSRKRAKIH